MTTTEMQPRSTDNATALFWELDGLRMQLDAAVEQYDMTTGFSQYQNLLDRLLAPLDKAIETVKAVQAVLALEIVKTAALEDPR